MATLGMDLGRVGKKLLEELRHRVRALEEDLKARREVEVEGMVAGVRARLEQRLALQPLPVAPDLLDRRGPLGLGRVRTQAFSAPPLRKVVLSHVALPPVVEGLALTLLPELMLDVPCFAADLMALPTRVSVHADVYGADWQTRRSLQGLRTTFVRLGSGPGPLWAARLSSGHGLHVRLRPRQVDEGFAALTQALAAYLDELQDGPPGRSTTYQQAFFQAFHTHGPRRRLAPLLGQDWAERYSRLLFE
ncbi:MAG: hypothetical protein RMK29_10325 [Myxococcales bacterium]|nr:phytochromobilin:ferredoxin oxidoreductase [Myxococcota bacterium]MDW8282099.1 hypothetical protein [Myxococcales bacterium]